MPTEEGDQLQRAGDKEGVGGVGIEMIMKKGSGVEDGVKADEKGGVAVGPCQQKGNKEGIAKWEKPQKGLFVINARADDEDCRHSHQAESKDGIARKGLAGFTFDGFHRIPPS